jgi:hypothetical protein
MASVTGSGWAAGGKRMRLTRGLRSVQTAIFSRAHKTETINHEGHEVTRRKAAGSDLQTGTHRQLRTGSPKSLVYYVHAKTL